MTEIGVPSQSVQTMAVRGVSKGGRCIVRFRRSNDTVCVPMKPVR